MALFEAFPGDPYITIIPTLGPESVSITYIGLFGSLGFGCRE